MTDDPVTLYMREACSAPLLSRDEERTLARDLADARRRGNHARALQLRNELVGRNTRLAVHIARGHLGRGPDMADLISAANLGLIAAAEGFDPERGTTFSTYATQACRRAIYRALDEARLVRLPSEPAGHRRRLLGILARGARDLDEASREAGIEPELARLVRADTAPLGDSVHDLLSRDPAEEAANVDAREHLLRALDALPEREAEVVRLHLAGLTMDEVGDRLGDLEGCPRVSRERVRQILVQARERLAEELRRAE